MSRSHAIQLLNQFKSGNLNAEAVLDALALQPFENLDFAHVDTHRGIRQGFPEVIFGSGKTPEQIVAIAARLAQSNQQILVTRVSPEQANLFLQSFPTGVHHEVARCLTLKPLSPPVRSGSIFVLSAGTSDIPVAEEAALTAAAMGNPVERIFDVGVAGLHRLLGYLPRLRTAKVLIVVAGMEGALPSVVAGLVSVPVIAVPTSIGYGASFNGLAALLGMLNSCGSGVTVVNIDNGFGAGFAANQINQLSDSSADQS